MNIATIVQTPSAQTSNMQVFDKAPEQVTNGGLKKYNLFIWKEGPLTFATLSVQVEGSYSSEPFKSRISGSSKGHVLETLKQAAEEAKDLEMITALKGVTIH